MRQNCRSRSTVIVWFIVFLPSNSKKNNLGFFVFFTSNTYCTLKLCLIRTPSPVYLKQAVSGRHVTLVSSESVQFLMSKEISLDSEPKVTYESILITGRDLDRRQRSFRNRNTGEDDLVGNRQENVRSDNYLKNIAADDSYAPTTRSG